LASLDLTEISIYFFTTQLILIVLHAIFFDDWWVRLKTKWFRLRFGVLTTQLLRILTCSLASSFYEISFMDDRTSLLQRFNSWLYLDRSSTSSHDLGHKTEGEKWSKCRWFFKFWIQFGMHKNDFGPQVGRPWSTPKLNYDFSNILPTTFSIQTFYDLDEK
jgi:hypothetical protein